MPIIVPIKHKAVREPSSRIRLVMEMSGKEGRLITDLFMSG